MNFRKRTTPLTKAEVVVLRMGAVGMGYPLGRIAQELIIEAFYPSRGSTESNPAPLISALVHGDRVLALTLLYFPVALTGMFAAAMQLLVYRLYLPGQKPSALVLVSSALLASTAHALVVSPTHIIIGQSLTFLLSASAVGSAALLAAVVAVVTSHRRSQKLA